MAPELQLHYRCDTDVLTEYDVQFWTKHEEPNAAERHDLDKILKSGEVAVSKQLQIFQTDIEAITAEERGRKPPQSASTRR